MIAEIINISVVTKNCHCWSRLDGWSNSRKQGSL